MITAFRLCKTKHLATALTGEGARLNGGRWNSPGRPVVYAASSLSLATLEVLVHLEDPEAFARLFSWFRLEIPTDAIARLDLDALPDGWADGETNIASRAIGDDWLRSGETLALVVPSVVTPDEWNYLINPAHPRFAEIRAGERRPFRPHPRLGR